MQTHSTHTTTTAYSNPYVKSTPASPPATAANTVSTIGQKFGSATKKTENLAGNLFSHFKTGPGLVNVAMTRIDHAAKSVYKGGSDHIFRKEFGYNPGEKLKNTYACYLSITGGPVSGTLFVSNLRLGFKSDSPVWTGPGVGPGQWVYYKVIMWLNEVGAISSMANNRNWGDKYIEIVSKDGYGFWLMGFISYEEAVSNLYEVLENCRAGIVSLPRVGY